MNTIGYILFKLNNGTSEQAIRDEFEKDLAKAKEKYAAEKEQLKKAAEIKKAREALDKAFNKYFALISKGSKFNLDLKRLRDLFGQF